MSDLPQCPTPCDDDCELRPDGCHEEHQVPWKRGHQPYGCQDIRVAIGAAAARAAAAERERIRQFLLSGDPSRLESAFREFVDDEEAADCALAVAHLLADGHG